MLKVCLLVLILKVVQIKIGFKRKCLLKEAHYLCFSQNQKTKMCFKSPKHLWKTNLFGPYVFFLLLSETLLRVSDNVLFLDPKKIMSCFN